MNKRSHHVRSERILFNVEVVRDGSILTIDVFIKILDATILSNPVVYSKTAPLPQDNVEDLRVDPRFNSTAKTFFTQYSQDISEGSPFFQIALDYGPNGENTLIVSGIISA